MKHINFVLSLLALLLAFLVGINMYLSSANNDLLAKLNNAQQAMANSRNNELALRTLTLRIAQGAVKDSALRDLLVKHQLRATIDVNGQQKEMP